MNSSKRGLSSAAKMGIVVALVVLVLGGAYLGPSLSKGGGQNSSQTVVTCSSQSGGNQTIELPLLFACFSQMQVQNSMNTGPNQGGVVTQEDLAYLVLGTATFNSTQHTKVEFSQVGVGDNVIAWYNPAGKIDRLDDLRGGKNYTGPGAPYFALTYTAGFGLIPQITNNATLLSMLSKTSENMTSIGATQLDVTTYHLVVPTHQIKSLTVKYAAIPGTNVRFAVYLDQKSTDGSETTIQVLSVTK